MPINDEFIDDEIPDIELFPAKLIQCVCGSEILARTIDGVLPVECECCGCGHIHDDNAIDKAQTIWWFDCSGCGREMVAELERTQDGSYVIPDSVECPECESVFIVP